MEYITPEEQAYLAQQPQLPPQPISPNYLSNQSPELMESLLDLKAQTIEPLRRSWAGEVEVEPGVWKKKEGFAIMNDKGIFWCIGQMERFLNSTFSMSNLDENMMNWHMRLICRTVWNGVAMLYLEWDLSKKNIQSVCNGIIQTCNAVLLMARGDGTRRFLSTTHQVNEQKSTSVQHDVQGRRRVFGLFSPKQQQPPPPPMNY